MFGHFIAFASPPNRVALKVRPPRRLLSTQTPHPRRTLRCALPPLTGYGALAVSCGVGLLSSRAAFVPRALRGAPASFVTAVVLRAVAGAGLQPACDAVLAGAPAGVALLLLTSASGRTSEENPTGSSRALVLAFAIGALGAVAGAAAGALLLARIAPAGHALHIAPVIAAPLAAAFAATYIGGSLNFVAVVATSGLGQAAPHVVAAALSADLSLMAVYFGMLFLLASKIPRKLRECAVEPTSVQTASRRMMLTSAGGAASDKFAFYTSARTVASRKVALCCVAPSIACTIFLIARTLAHAFGLGASADVVIVTVLALAFRVGLGSEVKSYGRDAADFALMLFFAALGGCVTVGDLGLGGAPVAMLCCTTLFVHALFMFLAWKGFHIQVEDCLVASNANIGGATTAAAFAAAEGWDGLVGPAAFVGAMGYAIATPIALLLISILDLIL